MNDHPLELLPLLAEGALVEPEVGKHIEACERCSAALASLSPVDLDYVWTGIAADIAAPTPGPLERLLRGLGLEPSLARFGSATPTLRPAWLLGMLAVVALSLGFSFVPRATALPPVLLAAPLIGAVAVAFAYGPFADPAYEVVATTPVSPVLALLVRLAAVLTVNALLVGCAVAIAMAGNHSPLGAGRGFAWVLPMAAVSLFAAVIGARTQPLVGAAAGMGTWVGLILFAQVSRDPGAVLWGPGSQAAYGAATVALLVSLAWWTAKGVAPGLRPNSA